MIRTLIVEDELLARTGLRILIDWKSYGFELLEDAVDGEDAYAKIRKERPELVLLDLDIPKINGIKLLELLEKNHIQTKVIICSCDTTFESAVSAMKCGASYYLMKYGLTKEELLKALEKVTGFSGTIKEEPEEQTPLCDLPSFDDLPKSYGEGTALTLLLPPGLHLNASNNGIVADFAKNFFSSIKAEVQVFCRDDSFLLLVGRSRLPQDLLSSFREELGFLLAGSISLTYSFVSSATRQDVVAMVKKTQVQQFLYGDLPLFQMEVPDKEKNSPALSFYLPLVDVLEKDLQDAALERIPKDLENIFSLLEKNAPDSMSIIRQTFVAILSRFTRCAEKMGGNIEDIVVKGRTNHNQVIVHFLSLSEARSWFLEFSTLFLSHFALKLKSADSAIVRKALEYVDDHISQSISLSDAASYAGVSDSYLSSTFKETIGDNFIHFVNARKILKAKELLASGMMVRTVAEMLGYSDVSYFSKVFKKMEGVSPESFFKA